MPESGASVASDLYTVARTLAVLTIDFAGFQDEKRYAVRLPARQDVPVFQRYESFHRFLQKATATDPTTRFQSAGEMAEQLVGVLRQVVATDGGTPAPAPSTLFSAELGAVPDGLPWDQLPVPAVDPNDSASGVLATLALVGSDQRPALLETVPRSPELSLFIARSAIEAGEFTEAARELDTEEARQSGWRAAWWRAALSLAEGRGADAVSFFTAVDRELPGELAPKLALAACLEQAEGEDVGRELRNAARYYGIVAATDPGYASASFGLARVAMRLGDREEAVSALRRIPRSSSAWVDAQIMLCRVQCEPIGDEMPQVSDLVATSQVLGGLVLENSVRLPLVRNLHQHALAMLLDGRAPPDESVHLMGAEFEEQAQRAALEVAIPVPGQACGHRRGSVRPRGSGERLSSQDVDMSAEAVTDTDADVGACRRCESPVFHDELYCEACGLKVSHDPEPSAGLPAAMPAERDTTDLGAMAGITDRGRRRLRNEDAFAIAAAGRPVHRCRVRWSRVDGESRSGFARGRRGRPVRAGAACSAGQTGRRPILTACWAMRSRRRNRPSCGYPTTNQTAMTFRRRRRWSWAWWRTAG